MEKTTLSKTDTEYFKQFRARYPDWGISRLEDWSLVMTPPVRLSPKKKERIVWKS